MSSNDNLPIVSKYDYMFQSSEIKIESISDFFYKITPHAYRFVRGKLPNIFFKTKMVAQKAFRKNHISDEEDWNFDEFTGEIIHKRLVSFYNYIKKCGNGFPLAFQELSDVSDSEYSSEEYAKKVASGEIIGGGYNKWVEVINEMVFAFEYYLYHDDFGKDQKAFYKKWNLSDPYLIPAEGKEWEYIYKNKKEKKYHFCDLKNYEILKDNKNVKFVGKCAKDTDWDSLKKLESRARKGMEYFGRFFWNMWD